jgi:chromosome segregation ATPase
LNIGIDPIAQKTTINNQRKLINEYKKTLVNYENDQQEYANKITELESHFTKLKEKDKKNLEYLGKLNAENTEIHTQGSSQSKLKETVNNQEYH